MRVFTIIVVKLKRGRAPLGIAATERGAGAPTRAQLLRESPEPSTHHRIPIGFYNIQYQELESR